MTAASACMVADDPKHPDRPPSTDATLDETWNEEPSRRQENDHSAAEFQLGPSIDFCQEVSSRQYEREQSENREPYPSVQEITVLRPVSVDNSNGEVNNPSTTTQAAATERCDGESDAVLLDTVQDDEQPATVVTVESINAPTTATVVETVEEFSDDAMIRKILQEDLLASGRSTVELQDFIQHASLESVVSMMEEREAQAEEEKMDIIGWDSAIAWAHIDHEQSLAAIHQRADELDQRAYELAQQAKELAVPTVPDEQATVVTITDHDVHPADISNADAHAEFIGPDYSVRVVPDVLATAAAAAAAIADEEDAMEATVLDSKPAVVPPLWSGESTEEATVLETKPPAEETWSMTDEEQEVMVEGVVEDEATVVEITEDVHPAEFECDEVRATLIGRDFTRGASFSAPQGHRPPLVARRATSVPDQPRATIPFDEDTSDVFEHGIAALDSMEEQNWMSSPATFGEDDELVMLPPPVTPAVAVPETGEQGHGSAPIATAEVVNVANDDISDVPSLPAATSPPGREVSRGSTARSDGSSGTHDSARRSLQMLSTAAVHGAYSMRRSTTNVMEMLFGDNKHPQQGFDLESAAGSILPRTLLPWSVFPNESRSSWVATLNTNQKALDSNNVSEASKALRAFSCLTQEQAMALARAWAPPRMLPFANSPTCFICESRFAIFKRACHCRNCGVCVCANCIVQWPSKMLPETYNIKKESMLNICKSCDWLCSTFRLALLRGHHDQAIAAHATGNVNLVTPFANVKGELFYPVHCAVLGGSLSLLKWLVEDHYCPLRATSVGGRRRDSGNSYTPILTSRGRSVLGIAMENESLEIVRYLVVEKGMALAEVKNLSLETTITTLQAALHLIPTTADGGIQVYTSTQPTDAYDSIPAVYSPPNEYSSPVSVTCSQHEAHASSPGETVEGTTGNGGRIDDVSSDSLEDACIICFAKKIDCVVTPCGHQICCMQCSTYITRCPICSVDCSFIRVYKP